MRSKAILFILLIGVLIAGIIFWVIQSNQETVQEPQTETPQPTDSDDSDNISSPDDTGITNEEITDVFDKHTVEHSDEHAEHETFSIEDVGIFNKDQLVDESLDFSTNQLVSTHFDHVFYLNDKRELVSFNQSNKTETIVAKNVLLATPNSANSGIIYQTQEDTEVFGLYYFELNQFKFSPKLVERYNTPFSFLGAHEGYYYYQFETGTQHPKQMFVYPFPESFHFYSPGDFQILDTMNLIPTQNGFYFKPTDTKTIEFLSFDGIISTTTLKNPTVHEEKIYYPLNIYESANHTIVNYLSDNYHDGLTVFLSLNDKIVYPEISFSNFSVFNDTHLIVKMIGESNGIFLFDIKKQTYSAIALDAMDYYFEPTSQTIYYVSGRDDRLHKIPYKLASQSQ